MEEKVKPRILVVEDEASLARFLQLELNHEGYQVETAQNGYEALGRIGETGWDLVLLDLMLPGLDGFEVCRRIREQTDVPIIMLTARDATLDKVKGLDTGADDYITKPFAVEELLARIRARLRRAGTARQEGDKLVIGDLVIRRGTRQVTRSGQIIPLTRREFDLLAYLAENAGLVLSRETILNRVWGYDYCGNTNVVDVYVRYLRAKIDEPFPTRLLHTVRGVGYTLREEK
ncbi:response regulator transcription factor [Desulfofundulus thermosubterraneus]|uniref:Stage 0 sporulation protein A homolog n=1 Tax=Desulfofundulus thermosubterraneus DSM 16057 TaxID=1121432 RepID=A0A1M6IDP4_9FIRM|nr:response regulator transcription factor [Desulfofundulus thermosubterraneus]SHJ32581.1 DNA-binding response regulator, OmpR family, contains REC and winged-helix (wHTH) domain [Desulfofundulus thermosubterraneus DSM 16057]